MPSSGVLPNGKFSLRWNGIAIDTLGDETDIVMTVDNIRCYGYTNTSFITMYTDGVIIADALSNNYPSEHGPVRNCFDITYNFYKSGTDIPADGDFVMMYNDIDVYREGTGWSETVQLNSNYGETVHIIPDDMYCEGAQQHIPGCWLDITNLDTYPTFSASKTGEDWNTMHTGFCLQARNGYNFTWWGENCGTGINSIYGQSKITATHDKGGMITDIGTTEVAWKHDKTYTATADKHHTISSITIDGKEIPITDPKEQSYTFESVISEHTIHASFTSTRHMLIYNANVEVFAGDTPSSVHDAGTDAVISDNGFIRDGYQFVGWNTTSDGSGGAYSPNENIFIDDEDITLYAQWKKLVIVTFMDDDGTVYGSETLPIGGSAAPPQMPTKQGYTFAGWGGIYTDVEKDEVVIASWRPNQYTIVYDPNGGDGIHMLDQ